MNEYALAGLKRFIKRTSSWRLMRRMDCHEIPDGKGEVRLFAVVRDEKLRLPWFLDYYFGKLGVDRMFVVDNGSTDGTLELLLAHPKIHVFETAETYTRQEAWIDALLRRFGRAGWSIVIDVDEMLMYPAMDRVPLREFLRYLDTRGFNGVHALQLDMYADKPLGETHYEAGQNPLEVTPFFDTDSCRTIQFPYRNCSPSNLVRFAGGMRQRVFGLQDVCISKFPLLKFGHGMFLRQGTHAIEGSSVADVQAAILHFKFLSDFGPRTAYEAERGEHWNGASQYKAYAKVCGQDPSLNLSYPGSRKFTGEKDLLDLGYIASSSAFEEFSRIR